ncbi:MAG: MFS transporter [Anaerolineales bacterium]|nr:MFS transporter [Anaerolineales bacterium]
MESKLYKKVTNAWVMYDWANSAFATTVMAGFMPVYFRFLATEAGLSNVRATSTWAFVTTIALILIAFLAPPMGYMADRMAGKKRFLTFFAVLGSLASIALFIPHGSMYRLAGTIYVLANIGFAGANIFYNALLPHVAKEEDLDYISTKGYALGYLGGGILLILNVIMFMFDIPSADTSVRWSFVTVGLWWLGFSIPLWRHVKEPPTAHTEVVGFGQAFTASFKELANTFNKIRQYPEAFKLLLAFWLYNDGIGTIMKMAVAYGDEIGIDQTGMIAALALVQFVGIPFSFGFGWLAKKIGAKTATLIGLGLYALISLGGYFMAVAWHFWVLAFMVGLVQGGTQALSRSMFGAMVPKERSGEFFGFYSMSDKFAGIVGPLVFGAVGAMTGSSRFGIVSLVFFFVIGGWLLTKVDTGKGMAEAKSIIT